MSHLQRLVAQAVADMKERRKQGLPEPVDDVRPFKSRLLAAERNPLIAEVKRASPSRGPINPGLDPAGLARAYERGGAACLSVLTDRANFGGSLEDLKAARDAVLLPVLRKDFIVSIFQVYEARAWGADAVLLIAAAAPASLLEELALLAQELGLAVLFEVHEESELETAAACKPDLLGINARNLKTLEVHPETFSLLAPKARQIAPLVAESGVKTADDVRRLRSEGAAALLVGEALSSAPDPEGATRALVTA
jgi:indole-3-glycerol phosphate synthase